MPNISVKQWAGGEGGRLCVRELSKTKSIIQNLVKLLYVKKFSPVYDPPKKCKIIQRIQSNTLQQMSQFSQAGQLTNLAIPPR